MADEKLQNEEQVSKKQEGSGSPNANEQVSENKEVKSQDELSPEALKAELERARREAASYRVKAKKLEDAQKEAERKQLEEQKKYKELYEKAEQERIELENKIAQEKEAVALKKEAEKAGFINPEDIRLLDLSEFEFDGKGFPGLDTAIAEMKKQRPYLFKGSNKIGDNATGANPPANIDAMDDIEKYAKLSRAEREALLKKHVIKI